MPTKTEAIKNFLMHKARPELAEMYSANMEVQVNVLQGDGERVDGEYKGKRWSGWTDGHQTWKAIRIPFHAKTVPEYTDTEIKFDLAVHTEGIGMTGWDWVNKKSRWVAFDFDAIMGHSEAHSAKLTDEQLADVRRVAQEIPWVTVRQSTSGNGLHLYVYLEGVDTGNHTEHAAVARAILGTMSAITGYDFDSKVDNCGGNIWVWHVKYDKAGGVNGPGLKTIKQGTILKEVPANWRDHIKVTSGSRRKANPQFVEANELTDFEELCGQRPRVPLDVEHRKLIAFLMDSHGRDREWDWNPDAHMLVCHTMDLQAAHEKLKLRGVFKTASSGSSTQNCFCFPMRKGVWSVRRHTPGVKEAETWNQDGAGWTVCYLNRDPDITTAARMQNGNENDKGTFVFKEVESAITAAKTLGATVEVPAFMTGRPAYLRPHKDGNRLIFEIDYSETDNADKMNGWIKTKRGGLWQKVLNIQTPPQHEAEVINYEDIVRHLVVEQGKDAGWMIKSDGRWCDERLEHIKCALVSLGVKKDELTSVIGASVMRRWTLVNAPFQPEYPGDRRWNRDAAQFRCAPAIDTDSLKFDIWTQVLEHCGGGLDFAIKTHPWCIQNGIRNGGDYLKLWVAHMFQKPLEQLPYLFFYGPEGSGKSIFHEAIEQLVTKGVSRADAALISPSGFNGELEGAILCVVEETDLRQGKAMALNRIKDWVTARSAPIHRKNGTPYTVQNSWHWCQTANDIGFCPTFPGDTRIVVIYVPGLPIEQKINKSHLLSLLTKQAPDFLAHIMTIDLPESYDRLNLPVIATEEKKQAQSANRTPIEEFLSECTFPVDGEMIKFSEIHERLIEWLPPSLVSEWTIIRFGRELVKLGYLKGRVMSKSAQWYIGNISFVDKAASRPRFKLEGEKLV